MKKIFGVLAIILGLSPLASAQTIFPQGPGLKNWIGTFVNEAGLTFNNTYPVDIGKYNGYDVSAQVIYGSTTYSNATFKDGKESTGTITVVTNTAIASATATTSFTVVSTANANGTTLTISGQGSPLGAPIVLTWGTDFKSALTLNGTAINIKSALQTALPGWSISTSAAVVFATAPYGAAYNQITWSVSDSSITISSPTMVGGVDPASITINGVTIAYGKNFVTGASAGLTAKNIAAAINAAFTTIVSSNSNGGSVIYTTSTANGTAYNYTWSVSTPALSLSAASSLTGGLNDAWSLNGSKISLPNHGFTLGLPVLYTAGSLAIGGLTDQTTYYVIPAIANSVQLATTSAFAQAGTPFVVLTSTAGGQITQHTYTLAPLAISGTPSFKWQVSNDNINWLDLGVSSVTVSSYTYGNAVAGWDFGLMDLRYLRLNVISPTQGGLLLQSIINIKQ